MSYVYRYRRVVRVLAAFACTLLGLAASAPAAFAMRIGAGASGGSPLPLSTGKDPNYALTHTVVTSGMPMWQLAVIAAVDPERHGGDAMLMRCLGLRIGEDAGAEIVAIATFHVFAGEFPIGLGHGGFLHEDGRGQHDRVGWVRKVPPGLSQGAGAIQQSSLTRITRIESGSGADQDLVRSRRG